MTSIDKLESIIQTAKRERKLPNAIADQLRHQFSLDKELDNNIIRVLTFATEEFWAGIDSALENAVIDIESTEAKKAYTERLIETLLRILLYLQKPSGFGTNAEREKQARKVATAARRLRAVMYEETPNRLVNETLIFQNSSETNRTRRYLAARSTSFIKDAVQNNADWMVTRPTDELSDAPVNLSYVQLLDALIGECETVGGLTLEQRRTQPSQQSRMARALMDWFKQQCEVSTAPRTAIENTIDNILRDIDPEYQPIEDPFR